MNSFARHDPLETGLRAAALPPLEAGPRAAVLPPLKTGLRAAALALAAAAGLTAAPIRAADGTLGRDGPPMSVSGAEAWTLRPSRPSAELAAAVAEGERIAPLAELPEARRRVRVVYQDTFTPAALSAPR